MGSYPGNRALDLSIGVPRVVLSAPVQATTALLIGARIGRPVVLRRQRPGRHGEPFEMGARSSLWEKRRRLGRRTRFRRSLCCQELARSRPNCRGLDRLTGDATDRDISARPHGNSGSWEDQEMGDIVLVTAGELGQR